MRAARPMQTMRARLPSWTAAACPTQRDAPRTRPPIRTTAVHAATRVWVPRARPRCASPWRSRTGLYVNTLATGETPVLVQPMVEPGPIALDSDIVYGGQNNAMGDIYRVKRDGTAPSATTFGGPIESLAVDGTTLWIVAAG